MLDGFLDCFARSVLPPGLSLKTLISSQGDDFCKGLERDVRALLDASDQVFRHRIGEVSTANQGMDVARVARQKDCGLLR